jgi:hypothetical protein
MNFLTDEQWERFQTGGYLHLGKIATAASLAALRRRINEIMLGTAPLDYSRTLMQLDVVDGGEGPGPQTKGHKGATLNYRKIQDLEYDDLFLAYMQHPLFRNICSRAYGQDAPVASFRAMFMNKPAGHGHDLTWHQDRWTDLDRDPFVTVWTALDPSTVDNGCVKIIPGSHKWGLVNPENASGFLSSEQIEERTQHAEHIDLELEAGEVVLLHNWLLHSSGTNHTDVSRRAFSTCYMHAATRSKRGQPFPVIFGENALKPTVV